tara:strand:+ start:11305 stop:11973 length:669 start_codon:yes stop_codon:yes gene_type:complete
MSPELMYAKFLNKINKGNTENSIACDASRFVLIVNECKNRWVEKGIKDKDSILIDSFQEIVKTKLLITPSDTTDKYTEFGLEEDYYEGILAKIEATSDTCKGVVYSREVKNQNKNILQWDANQRPDFEFEWTFHSIQGNKIRIYKQEFEIDSVDFEYYSVIPDIQMAGTVDVEGNEIAISKGIDLSDQYVDQIINLSAEEFMRNFENSNGLQIGKDRTNSAD